MEKKIIQTNCAPAAIGPYSQGVRVGQFLFLSGQIGLHPSGNLVEGGIEAQTKQVLENLEQVLKAAGATLEQVVKTSIYLKNLGDFATVNSIYGQYFSENPPARATLEVSRLPKDVLVEMEAIAYMA